MLLFIVKRFYSHFVYFYLFFFVLVLSVWHEWHSLLGRIVFFFFCNTISKCNAVYIALLVQLTQNKLFRKYLKRFFVDYFLLVKIQFGFTDKSLGKLQLSR